MKQEEKNLSLIENLLCIYEYEMKNNKKWTINDVVMKKYRYDYFRKALNANM